MLKTLGMDDDLDSVEAVEELERAFDVALADSEVAATETVGQMFELLRSKITRNEQPGKCASAMAFYRLRRALRGHFADAAFLPSDDLSSLRAKYTKSFRRKLEQEAGLRLPAPSFTWIGNLGAVIALIGTVGCAGLVVAALISLALPHQLSEPLVHAAPGFMFGGLVVFLLAAWLDPGRAPTSCKTFGDLAEETATLSYGALVRQGADASDRSLWQALTNVLSQLSNVPANEIARETYFLESAI